MKKLIVSLEIMMALLVLIPFLFKDFLIKKELKNVWKNEGLTVSYSKSKLDFFSFFILSFTLENVVINNEFFVIDSQIAKFQEVVLSL